MIDEVGQTVPQPQKDEAREKNKEKLLIPNKYILLIIILNKINSSI